MQRRFSWATFCLQLLVSASALSPSRVLHRGWRLQATQGTPENVGASAKQGLGSAIGRLSWALSLPFMLPVAAARGESNANTVFAPTKNNRNLAYSVEQTDPPSLLPRTAAGESSALSKLSGMQVVVLGCHLYTPTTLSLYNKTATVPTTEYSDTVLACSIIRRMARVQPGLIFGLDNVAATSAAEEIIESYLGAGQTISQVDEVVSTLLKAGLLYNPLVSAASSTASASAKQADVEMLRALLVLAKEENLALRPMALPPVVSKTLLVEGLEGIKYGVGELIPDPTGFVASVQGEGFSRYTNSVIKEDYSNTMRSVTAVGAGGGEGGGEKTALASKGGGLANIPSGEKYFSNRILLDETLASKIVATLRSVPQRTAPLVVVSDLSRVRFGYGLMERIKRLLLLPSTAISTETTNMVASALPTVASIMINPTAQDSLSLSNQLRLSLGYGIFLPASRPFAGA